MTTWRALPPRKLEGYYIFGEHEAIAEAVSKRLSPPTLGVYMCEVPIVSLGRHEKVTDVDLAYCDSAAIPATRRLSGGIVIIHKGDIIFNKVLSADLIPRRRSGQPDVNSIYRQENPDVVNALKAMGIPAELDETHPNDIRVAGKKIGGTAYAIVGDACLLHGSILYEFDIEANQKALKWRPEDLGKIGYITSISEHLPIPFEEATRRLYDGLVSAKKASEGTLDAAEASRARDLAKARYASREWLLDEGTGRREGICFTRT